MKQNMAKMHLKGWICAFMHYNSKNVFFKYAQKQNFFIIKIKLSLLKTVQKLQL